VQGALAKLRKRFENQIEFHHKNFPLRDLTFRAAEAALCVGDESKVAQMRTFIFNGRRRWSTAAVAVDIWEKYALAAGANVDKWRSCMASQEYRHAIEADRNLGIRMGVRATPTIFVGKERFDGARSFNVLAAAVRAQVK
jgi:protein-disulfide isomerase